MPRSSSSKDRYDSTRNVIPSQHIARTVQSLGQIKMDFRDSWKMDSSHRHARSQHLSTASSPIATRVPALPHKDSNLTFSAFGQEEVQEQFGDNSNGDAGSTAVLTIGYHEARTCPEDVVIPDANKVFSTPPENGDLMVLTRPSDSKKLYFIYKPITDEDVKRRLINSQISVINNDLSKLLNIPGRSKVPVSIMKNKLSAEASSIDLYFKDVHLSRADMWRISSNLVGKCLYDSQKLLFYQTIRLQASNLRIDGKRVSSALIGQDTRVLFRSGSVNFTLFIQMSKEMWHFDESGEVVFHKVVNSFLPELFRRWRDSDVHHLLSIIIFTSVDLNKPPHSYGWGERSENTRDFYRVVVHRMKISRFADIMATLRFELTNFLRQVLLQVNDQTGKEEIIGTIAPAMKGNLLEAVNTYLSQHQYPSISPDLRRTTYQLVIITPGCGMFDVDYDLLLRTSESLLSYGVVIDLVCVSRIPLHPSPVFRYKDPEQNEKVCHCVPHWADASYWKGTDRQSSAAWVPQCRTYELQMMGVMENEMQAISLEYLDILNAKTNAALALLQQDKDNNNNNNNDDDDDDDSAIQAQIADINMIDYDDDVFKTEKQINKKQAIQKMEAAKRAGIYKSNTRGNTSKRQSPLSSMGSTPVTVNNNSNLNNSGPGTNISPSARSPFHHFISPQAENTNTRVSPAQVPPSLDSSTRPNVLARLPSTSSVIQFSKQSSDRPGLNLGKAQPVVQPTTEFADVSASTKEASENGRDLQTQKSNQQSESNIQEDVSSSKQPIKSRLSALTSLLSFGINRLEEIPSSVINAAERRASHHTDRPDSLRRQPRQEQNVFRSLRTQSPRMTSPMFPGPHSSTLVNRNQSIPRSQQPQQPESSRLSSSAESRTGNSRRAVSLEMMKDSVYNTGDNGYHGAGSGGNKNMTLNSAREGNIGMTDFLWYVIPNICQPRQVIESTKVTIHGRWSDAYMRSQDSWRRMKWGPFLSPATLPLTTQTMPSEMQISRNFTFQTYEVILDSDVSEYMTTRDLIKEMISLRLILGFQIVVGSSVKAIESKRMLDGDPDAVYKFLPDDYLGSRIYLSKGNQIHRISCEWDGNLSVQLYRRSTTDSVLTRHISYQMDVKARTDNVYHKVNIEFISPFTGEPNWNLLDQRLAGYDDTMWRSRSIFRNRFVLLPKILDADTFHSGSNSNNNNNSAAGSIGVDDPNEKISNEELRLEGLRRLIAMFVKNQETSHMDRRIISPTVKKPSNIKLVQPLQLQPETRFYTSDFTSFVQQLARESSEGNADIKHKKRLALNTNASLQQLAKEIQSPTSSLKLVDRRWHLKTYPRCFIGHEFVDWLIHNFSDIDSADKAVQFGNDLMNRGFIRHVEQKHRFLNGFYFYYLNPDLSAPSSSSASNTRSVSGNENPSMSQSASSSTVATNNTTTAPSSGSAGGGLFRRDKTVPPTAVPVAPSETSSVSVAYFEPQQQSGGTSTPTGGGTTVYSTSVRALSSLYPVSSRNSSKSSDTIPGKSGDNPPSSSTAPSLSHGGSGQTGDNIQQQLGLERTASIEKASKPQVLLSSRVQYDADTARHSDRPETFGLHFDRIYNPHTCYHIQLEWINTTPKFVADSLNGWARTCDRYGLTMAEVPMIEACELPKLYSFRSLLAIRLALAPPDLSKIAPYLDPIEAASKIASPTNPLPRIFDAHFFQRLIVDKFEFLFDMPASQVPEWKDIDVSYTWGRSEYKYSQYIHISGIGLLQISSNGELILMENHLYNPSLGAAPSRSQNTAQKRQQQHASTDDDTSGDKRQPIKNYRAASREIRSKIEKFCSNVNELKLFYNGVFEKLGIAPINYNDE